MTTIISIEGAQLQITPAGPGGPTFSLTIEDWRTLNRAVEAVIDDTYLSYDDAKARLGVHRSTLSDWIAQGKLERMLIGGRGYVTATSVSAVISERPRSVRRPAVSTVADAGPALNPESPHPASGNHRHSATELTARREYPQTSADQFPKASPMSLSSKAWALVRELTDREKAIEPTQFPADPAQAERPGMYSWWGDDEACAVLGEEIGMQLPHLLYVGQAGATRWPSGVKSAATLASRIGTQHIKGNARSSTFRHTISSLLAERLRLVPESGGKLDPASNARTSAWIADHLRIVIAPFDDRDVLGRLEKEVVAHLDPPLNLDHCPPSEARARITKRRVALSR